MSNLPYFFQQYELAADADERAVKRTYARQLKKIDQENDLEGFQVLRESYEHALEWLKYRSRMAPDTAQYEDSAKKEKNKSAELKPAVEPVLEIAKPKAEAARPVAPAPERKQDAAASKVKKTLDQINWPQPLQPTPPRFKKEPQSQEKSQAKPEPKPESKPEPKTQAKPQAKPQARQPDPAEASGLSPATLAEQVFAEMLKAMRAQADKPEFAGHCLRQVLDDARLYHMEARHAFERMLAAYLVKGWRYGNGELLDAAYECFGWNKDRKRMLNLGQQGHLLDQAFMEMSAFQSQGTLEKQSQRDLLLKFRKPPPPGATSRGRDLRKLESMAELYPAWIWMMTSKDNFLAWKAFSTTKSTSHSFENDDAHEKEPIKMRPRAQASGYEKVSFFESLKRGGRLLSRIYLAFIVIMVLGVAIHGMWTKDTPEPGRQQVKAPATPEEKFNAAFAVLKAPKPDPESAAKAIASLTQLANSGYVRASYQLGWTYQEGEGTARDEAEALKWFIKASEQGHLAAKVMAGDYYFEGKGGPKDIAAALHWYELAADRGHSLAQVRLAHMYASGTGVKKDGKRALDLLVAAAEKGLSIAQSELGLIRLHGTYDSEKDEKKAAYWFMLSARQNDIVGQRMFGQVYEKGLGGYSVDLVSAAVWYGKAAAQGDKDASRYLKNLCMFSNYLQCSYQGADVRPSSIVR